MEVVTTPLYRHPRCGLLLELRRARVLSDVLVRTAEVVTVKTFRTAELLKLPRVDYPGDFDTAFHRFTHPVLGVAKVDPICFSYQEANMAKHFILNRTTNELVAVAASAKGAKILKGDQEDVIIAKTVEDLAALPDGERATFIARLGGEGDSADTLFALLNGTPVEPKVRAPRAKKEGGAVAQCHELFEKIHAEGGGRKEAMEQGVALGLNKGTLATQWQKFRVAKGLNVKAAETPETAEA